MSKRVATIILNRNLPEVTDRLHDAILRKNGDLTDVFVVESGSDQGNLAKSCTWWANWPEAVKNGLRYPRGFNFGLAKLWEEKRFKNYDFFFFVANDVEFEDKPFIATLIEEMEAHPRVGILSPCSKHWGEARLLAGETRYFYHAHLTAWFVRRSFIECVMEPVEPNYMNFFFDGNNFRGYISDLEIIAKGYINDWATAITAKVWAEENESYLKTKADLIRTEPFDENQKKVLEESRLWMRRKYGFNQRWSMQLYAKCFYEEFLKNFPIYAKYRV